MTPLPTAHKPELGAKGGGDCHVFAKRLLEENFGAGVVLLHNKRHGAAVINAAESFIVVNSTARAAFALAKGA